MMGDRLVELEGRERSKSRRLPFSIEAKVMNGAHLYPFSVPEHGNSRVGHLIQPCL